MITIPNHVVDTARKHIECDKEISVNWQNIALCIDDKGNFRMYGENAWTPTCKPQTPWSSWSPPPYKPFAIITPDEIRILP